ncbi:putative protein conserved in bacteria [Candidatus Ornithobacterium hominis]|uniref:DUF3820 family protein n=1 Tax=Candidatus Ornithobacterium hominis TaxID=2497989 RepID=UPI0024BC0682|nr:DUF3820 family protein [Candidatus Ornithobacterium hominis]CAI9430222.1 putative protein conserved in bacteria [Candidatus Ornithobacterium hominis]
MKPDAEILKACVTTPMPFGKYKERKIADLPVSYLEWFEKKGFPAGKLGMLMSTVWVIKTNGLEELLASIKKVEKY